MQEIQTSIIIYVYCSYGRSVAIKYRFPFFRMNFSTLDIFFATILNPRENCSSKKKKNKLTVRSLAKCSATYCDQKEIQRNSAYSCVGAIQYRIIEYYAHMCIVYSTLEAFLVSHKILPNTSYACSFEKEMTQKEKQKRWLRYNTTPHPHVFHTLYFSFFLFFISYPSNSFSVAIRKPLIKSLYVYSALYRYLLYYNIIIRMEYTTIYIYYGSASTEKQIHSRKKRRCQTHVKIARICLFRVACSTCAAISFVSSLFLCRHARTIIVVPLTILPIVASVGVRRTTTTLNRSEMPTCKKAFQL